MNLPVILRPEAESDIRMIHQELEAASAGLGQQFATRLRELLERVEARPEMYGTAWQDVRAVRLKQFRYVIYYVAFADRTEVLGILHGARDPAVWQGRT